MAFRPAYDKSVEFLQRWCPEGRWVLVSIALDKTAIRGRTFYPGDEEKMVAWLEEKQANQDNIYFHVNTLTHDLEKKGAREDVQSVDWLHVDIDPRAERDVEEEQTRALEILQNPKNGLPRPTVIVFSGGGYQAFWRLEDPIEVGGSLAKAEDAKRWNKQIELLYEGADNCHNIDRIMRLPGTINFPDAKKQKKGRKMAVASVVEWNPDRVYSLDNFTKAPMVQQDRAENKRHKLEVSGNIRRLLDMDELDEMVSGEPLPDWIKMVIVQGHDPDEPNKHESRSEWQFAVSCQLVRSGIPDEVHFSILTDPDLEISKSILDKGGRAEAYALRQIARAKDEVEDPNLAEMNERHAVIGNWGGRCQVMQEVYDPNVSRYRITRQSFGDIQNRYLNQKVQIGVDKNDNPVYQPKGKWWLQHPMRRQYDSVVFVPNGDGGEGNYNLWNGFTCDPRPGSWSLFNDHLRDVLCCGVEEHYHYLLGWMAHAVQQPGEPGYSAVVLKGPQGAGKGTFANVFGALWGRHFMPVSSASHVVGNFNAHLRDVVVLFADEAFYAGDRKHRSTLKALITEQTLAIEAKGVDVELVRNCIHLIMASNEDWVVGAERDDRRYFVLEVDPTHKQDATYFRAIHQQMENGGYEAMLHDLMRYDLSGFDIRRIPRTKALQEQQRLSVASDEQWWFSKLHSGLLVDSHESWQTEVMNHELVYDFATHMRQDRWNSQRAAATHLGLLLKKMCPEGFPRSKRYARREVVGVNLQGKEVKYKSPRAYVLPDLETCRGIWEDHYGPHDWPEPPEVADDRDEEEDHEVF